MNIVIPTYKRAGKLEGKDYFKTAKYVVCDSQKDDYKKVLGAKRMIVIPDYADGSIARKRNWILRHVARPLVMIDDDVRAITMTEGFHKVRTRSGEVKKKATQKIRLTWKQAERVIKDGFNLAHQLQCVFWGLNINPDGRNYYQFMPFSLSRIVLGPFQAHLKHSLLYDAKMGTKEDYDFCLQVLHKHKRVLRLNKYAYDCDHGCNKGGLVSMRTMASEIEDCRAIEKKWGRNIIRYKWRPRRISDLLNGNVHIPIAGV